ncbi:unnamed protein product [Lymnaea stagnalis]|uniref:Uncharacterized protein n=1 Tax=Lymnaea stagnalis TaxID=6523 RepID=A0AAV2I418_LYMST
MSSSRKATDGAGPSDQKHSTRYTANTEAGPSSGVKRRRRRPKLKFQFPTSVPKNMQDVKFDTYIKKVLKKVKPRIKMAGPSIKLMDIIMKDTLHHIATEAKGKMGRRKTLKPKIIMKALKKIMSKNLVQRAHEHGQRALDRYEAKTKRRR